MVHPCFQASFQPDARVVSTVRRFTEELYVRTLHDVELSEKVALATHELLDNAINYATAGEAGLRIEIVDDVLSISTWNRASPANLAELARRIDAMNRIADADEYYQRMLAETAYRTDGSGLGLARVRAEAQMTISCEIHEDEVRVRAATRLAVRP